MLVDITDSASDHTLAPRRSDPLLVTDDTQHVAFSSTGQFLAAVNDSNEVRVFDVVSREQVNVSFHLRSSAMAASFSAHGTTMWTACRHGSVDQWDWQRGQRLVPTRQHKGTLTTAAISRHMIATSNRQPVTRIWPVSHPHQSPGSK